MLAFDGVLEHAARPRNPSEKAMMSAVLVMLVTELTPSEGGGKRGDGEWNLNHWSSALAKFSPMELSTLAWVIHHSSSEVRKSVVNMKFFWTSNSGSLYSMDSKGMAELNCSC